MKQKCSIAVIGAGAVGSFYGARLAESGHDVRFLLRRDYQAVSKGGLRVKSPAGDITLTNPTIMLDSKEIGPVDWVICTLKATSIEDAQELLYPCISANTRILVLMNGLGLEERFVEWFGPKRVFGGMAFIGVNRVEPGYIYHIAFGSITLGHFQNDSDELETAISLWNSSKVQVTASHSLLHARWEKLCWNIPFNGLAVAAGGITTDRIVGDQGLRDTARTLMEEVIEAGNGDLRAHSEDTRIDSINTIERMFELTDSLGEYKPSTMIDFVDGKAMEIEAIFGEPLRRAQSLGIATPQLRLLTSLLRTLDSGR